jgi:protocatechuate 3,4-dioxygenase beta subunit
METTNAWVDEPSNEELRAITRRSTLRLLGGAGLFIVAACVSDNVATTTTVAGTNPGTAAGATATTATFGAAGSCVLIPEETEGPFALDLSGEEPMFRSEITEGHPGVPLSLTMTLVNTPVSGARVDLWHCDAAGVYSGFSQPGTDTVGQTFCRGIQLTDDNGQVTFQTVYPGWYQDRITHVHFQVFLESGLAATSQIAFPEEVTDAVYAVEPYAAKGPTHQLPASPRTWCSPTAPNTRWRCSAATPVPGTPPPCWSAWPPERAERAEGVSAPLAGSPSPHHIPHREGADFRLPSWVAS